ncbi:type IV pilus assembly protein PilO [Thiohalospira halophila DSM 15071]|uniref:Type IV pilus assembly protein PilO n=1 Tax=Thiohalospira halophila DSM 15071 TaxID=1123397 RepID=A0A1I1TCA4_9GAMM|nr:type 4a pilus biogenesis protein PilO [Thiohalospira halophila]SFD56219.1 type IV pilus assembly protein PilO [Thiohalospira halophila DSM 15071]
MALSDLNNIEIDLATAHRWPRGVRLLLAGMGTAVVLVLAGLFLLRPAWSDLTAAEAREEKLLERYADRRALAADLPRHRQRMEAIRDLYRDLLERLPRGSEMARLLTRISEAGRSAGLRFERFEPLPEVPDEFYAEAPVRLRLSGTFTEFGHFVQALVELPRVVTIGDVTIETNEEGEGVTIEMTARTYRYRGGEEET